MTALTPSDSLQILRATAEDEGMRLDLFVAYRIPELSRRSAQALIESGDVLLNGREARKSDELRKGDTVEIKRVGHGPWLVPAADPSIEIGIIYIDDFIIVIDKPSGISSVPLRPTEIGTAANALVARYPECGPIGRRPGDGGLLQRLDRGTSGLMLAARQQTTFNVLRDQQDQGQMPKTYLAVAPDVGLPRRVDYRLAPSGPGGVRMRPTARGGVSARTDLEVIARQNELMLVRATITHGARHQIRAHLASCGAPILGDELYGGNRHPRLLLHCHVLSLVHPSTKKPLELRSEVPTDFWPPPRT